MSVSKFFISFNKKLFFSNSYSFYLNLCLLIATVFFIVGVSRASEFVYCTTGSSRINDYGEELLKLVLASTDDNHSFMRINQTTRNHKRLVLEFNYGQSPCSVLIFSSEITRNKGNMRMVPIPLTQGLLGYRVLVYSESMNSKWQEITTFEEVKLGFTIASGTDWNSSKLLTDEGFNVISGHSVETLWRMLHGGRFDLFHRGIYEAYHEKKQQAALGKKIFIDDKFLFNYKCDFFFFVKSDDKKRQEILTTGLEKLHKNGDFKKFFQRSFFNILTLDNNYFTGRKVLRLNDKESAIMLENIPENYWN